VTAAALVFVGIAVLIHGYIFVLESLRWSAPSTRKTFGIRSQEQADATKPLAFNQGFYNLFLALIALAGMVFLATGADAVGAALIVAGAGSMVLAGLVLLVSSRRLWRAALVQLGPPAVGLIFLALAG
jgi:putative membrane protein